MGPRLQSARQKLNILIVLFIFLSALTGGCQPKQPPSTATHPPPIPTTTSPPTDTPVPQGETILVTSTDDNGPGTLRQAIDTAQPYDTITFDPVVFPPDAPATIAVTSGLPQLAQGHLTIDASDAGVILDGSQLPADSWTPGIEIVSDGNTIRGLQVFHFTGTGIVVAGHVQNNTIGGDRKIGAGPSGQGNLTGSNDFGIGVWDHATNNTVTGNLVGTDASGATDLGNRSSGMWIETATDNVIGPDNIVAYSSQCGIRVEGAQNFGNTLTQNSIHDNSGLGICLMFGANTTLAAPFISEFDPTSGRISGSSCANCTVEIFSDSGDEGATYEGQAVADSSGTFNFDKGAAFANANVTLTATDSGGNTSEFSRSMEGVAGVIMLQAGNTLPKFPMLTKSSGELADNRIGMSYAGAGLWHDISYLDGVRDEVTDFGAKRVDSSLYEIEPPIEWSGSEYDIPPEFDKFINDLNANGIAFDYMLHFWDKEGHANGETLSTPRFTTDEQIQAFADYVRFVIRHFKGRVQYYTIWSEPDNCGQGGIKCIRPNDYINLAKQIIPVIRQEDPQAKVAIAPNVLFFARNDLFTVLESDAISMFDVVQWHGLYDVAPNVSFYGNYYYDYPELVEKIKQTASAHGFQGEYWETEMTWCSEEFPWCHPADQPWDQQKTDLLAAKYYARGIVMHLGMDVGVGIGGFQPAAAWSYPTIRNLNTYMAGVEPAELPVDIESQAINIVSYGFTLPNGDRLFALWTNGTAVEDDPGVITTLTFLGTSAQSVTGVDVLNGFEQELVTENENGNLIIRDLLVKDYPIILRITP